MSIEELCRKIGTSPDDLEAYADGVEGDLVEDGADEESGSLPSQNGTDALFARLLAGLIREVAELQHRNSANECSTEQMNT